MGTLEKELSKHCGKVGGAGGSGGGHGREMYGLAGEGWCIKESYVCACSLASVLSGSL